MWYACPVRHRRWIDGALATTGVLFGSASLAYPLTLDSGVNYYVAREWVLRGALPYRDTFDHRAPGIYLIHVACIALFGDHAWGIHLGELAVILTLGWLAAAVATPRGETPAPGARGAAVLASAIFYYGFFDYWCTAQAELWCALGVVAALYAIRRTRTTNRAALIAGLASGAALLLKPPAVPLIAVVAAVLVARARGERRGVRGIGWCLFTFLGAACVPSALVLAYFCARGGLSAMFDVLLGANAYYVTHEPANFTLRSALRSLGLAWRFFAPFDTLVVGLIVVGGTWAALARRATRRTYGLAAYLFAATIATTVLQRKFYLYHWSLAVLPVGVVAATAARELTRHASPRRAAAASLACAAIALAFYTNAGSPFDVWARTTRATVAWSLGRVDRAQLAATYSKLDRFYTYRVDYGDRERVGIWLRDHTSADDKILVRGMAAEIYALSGRRAPGRFFWSLFLTLPTRAYHREAWLREDREAIERDPPLYVVAYADIHEGPDSVGWFLPLGYEARERFGSFIVMERSMGTASRGHADTPAMRDEPRRL